MVASIAADVLGDPPVVSEEQEGFQCSGGMGVSNDWKDPGGGLLPHPRLRSGEPAGGVMEVNAWIEGLNFSKDLWGALDRSGHVVNDYLG